MVDKTEIARSAIGLLAVAIKALEESGDGADFGEQVQESVAALTPTFLDFDMEVDSSAECEDTVRRVASEVAEQCHLRTLALTTGFISAFAQIVRAYKRDCPDADVEGILQRTSLRLDQRRDTA